MSATHPFIGIFMNLGEDDREISVRRDAFLTGVNTNHQTGTFDPVPGLTVAMRFGNADFPNYLNIAKDLTSLQVDNQPPDLYFTTCWPSLRALKDTNPSTGLGIADPVVIAGLPGIAAIWNNYPNVFGFISSGTNICLDWVNLLLRINSNIKRVGVVYHQDTTYAADAGQIYQTVNTDVVSKGLPQAVKINCASVNLQQDIKNFKNSGATPAGLIVAMSALTARKRQELAVAAQTLGLPAVYPNRFYTTHGGDAKCAGLASRGADLLDLYTKAGGFARLLIDHKYHGGPLPNPSPTTWPINNVSAKFETVFNLNAAEAIGVAAPPPLPNETYVVIR